MTDHIAVQALAEFREGLLAESEAAQIRAHLAGCARCRTTEAELSRVAELLASAQAPPMPAELSRRIERALAAESAARASATATPSAGTPSAGTPSAGTPSAATPSAATPEATTPDAPARAAAQAAAGRRAEDWRTGARSGPAAGRPPGRAPSPLARSRARLRALAAAAAIVIVGGAGYGLAQLASHSSGASSAGVTSQRPAAAPLLGPNRAASRPASFAPVSSGTNYTRAHFARQVQAALRHYPAGSGVRQPSVGERGQPAALTGCVSAVTGGRRPRLVDLASYQGRPAIIIVLSGGSSAPVRAWAVGRDCTASRPDILARVLVPAAG